MIQAQRWLLIDAHNVLHGDVELRRLMAQPERARAELERLIAHRGRCTVFHDGGPGGEAQTVRRRGLNVVYSGTDEADDAIVRWLKQHPTNRAAVVTNDEGLRRRCRQLNAPIISIQEFLTSVRDRVEAPHRQSPQRSVIPPPLPPHEVDFWMREFKQDEPQA